MSITKNKKKEEKKNHRPVVTIELLNLYVRCVAISLYYCRPDTSPIWHLLFSQMKIGAEMWCGSTSPPETDAFNFPDNCLCIRFVIPIPLYYYYYYYYFAPVWHWSIYILDLLCSIVFTSIRLQECIVNAASPNPFSYLFAPLLFSTSPFL